MEIITGVERRRHWRTEDKLRIVAEAERPGARFVDVARRHEVSRGCCGSGARDRRTSGGRNIPDRERFKLKQPEVENHSCCSTLALSQIEAKLLLAGI
jgi:transposase-like protein